MKDKDNSLLYHPVIAEWLWEKNNACNLFPSNLSPGSGKRAFWKCSVCGNEWSAIIENRTRGGGCPVCGKKHAQQSRKENNLKKNGSLIDCNPILANEWNYNKNGDMSPSQFTCSSNVKVWWVCSKGHEWEAAINRRNQGRGCPYCSGRRTDASNSLASLHPELLSEWDFERNAKLPSEYSSMSSVKVWWKCSACGYTWQSVIKSRSNGHGCPKCAQEKRNSSNHSYRLRTTGSISNTNPELAKEWHPTKNNGLSPHDVTYGSQAIIWWKCIRGHEWQASVWNRVKGRGCPICNSGNQTSFPEQATLYYLRKHVRAESRLKLHNQEVDIFLPDYNVAIEYDGIYYHSSNKAIERDKRKSNTLEANGITLYRIKESDKCYVENNTIIHYSYDESLSQLSWAISTLLNMIGINSAPNEFNISEDRSSIEEQYLTVIKSNSVASLFPDLVNEWDYEKNGELKPEYYSCHSKSKVAWICKICGHRWTSTIKNRVNGSGCPLCAHRTVVDGINDLVTIKPEVMLDWDYSKNKGINPSDLAPNANIAVSWKCHTCGHEWTATVNNRSQGHGCYKCSKIEAAKKRIETIIKMKGSLKDHFPALAEEWNNEKNNGLLPSMVTTKSAQKVWWKCSKCGHEWQAHIYSRTQGHGCPRCAVESPSI